MKISRYEQVYLILAGVFIAALVSCNLIFQKFFTWTPFGLITFNISVGILPYPITFLVTDILSEIYGKKRADMVVASGFIASLFMMVVVTVAQWVPPVEWSPVDQATFVKVFGLAGPAVMASMTAYLVAQFIDIRIFHFWKKLTGGRHLWLRNNGSTVLSQLIDTGLVLSILSLAKVLTWEQFPSLLLQGFLFKVLVAAFDTPIFYGLVALFKKWFPEEIAAAKKLDPSAG